MVLVDTTVWIDWLRRKPTAAAEGLRILLGRGQAAIAPVILQELLQGASSADALKTLRTRFEALPMLKSRPGVVTYAEAGSLYARCRWAGYTPRSPHDCLIAQLAIEHRVPLLHDDRDFDRIAGIEPRLVSWEP